MIRRAYVAGPMRGIPYFNFPAFLNTTAELRERGWEVFNPAEQDVEAYGDAFWKENLFGDVGKAKFEYGFSLREALRKDLSWICENANTIVMLPGWEQSAGAKVEHALAVTLDLHIMYWEQGIGRDDI